MKSHSSETVMAAAKRDASSEPAAAAAVEVLPPACPVLSKINDPADVRALPESDLPQLAQDMRDSLIYSMSESNPTSLGGHLGPNLGVVELTIALHRVFERPRTRCSGTCRTRPTSTSC